MTLSTSTKGSGIGQIFPLGRVLDFVRSSIECSSLRANRITSRALSISPGTYRDSSTAYNTGKTVEVIDMHGASLLLRF